MLNQNPTLSEQAKRQQLENLTRYQAEDGKDNPYFVVLSDGKLTPEQKDARLAEVAGRTAQKALHR